MDDKQKKFECAHCGFTADNKFTGDICPDCGLTFWKCGQLWISPYCGCSTQHMPIMQTKM